MTSVKAHLHTTIAATVLAVGALSAPANATISTPFGGISAGGFGVGGTQQDFGVRTPWGGISLPGFSIGTPFGSMWGPGFGVGNAGPGANNYWTGFGLSDQQALSIKTPFGSMYGPGFGIGSPFPGFGIGFGPISANFGGFGLGGPGFPPGVVPFFGLNEQQALSVKTPWGGMYGPGFGISFGPFGGNFGGFGLNGAQTVGLSTPFGGFNMGGFGISTPWGSISGPGFGVSTPWGGMSTPFFGLNGQPSAMAPQIVPVMVPVPVPMQGPAMGAQGGAQPTQCMINAVPALTKSVDDCEKAGGAVPPQRTSSVQEAKKD